MTMASICQAEKRVGRKRKKEILGMLAVWPPGQEL